MPIKLNPNITDYTRSIHFTSSPNPSSDYINIDTEIDLNTHSIEIRDVSARLVQNYISQSSQIDISSLVFGYYHLLLVNSSGSIETVKPWIKR